MKLRWFLPIVVLLPLPLRGSGPVPPARIATVVINPSEVTPLHLRPEFDSVIRMPEEITSVILGSPESFKAEHNEGEPRYVYVKPITRDPAVSNLMIATKSGAHVTLELISDGAVGASATQAVDFLIEYRASHGFLVAPVSTIVSTPNPPHPPKPDVGTGAANIASTSALDEEYAQQMRINAPVWTHWEGNQIETSIGEIRQWNNRVAVSYSVLNHSGQPVEIVPPQIQIAGRKLTKNKEGKGITSDQLEIREYRLSKTRLEAGERVDGVSAAAPSPRTQYHSSETSLRNLLTGRIGTATKRSMRWLVWPRPSFGSGWMKGLMRNFLIGQQRFLSTVPGSTSISRN